MAPAQEQSRAGGPGRVTGLLGKDQQRFEASWQTEVVLQPNSGQPFHARVSASPLKVDYPTAKTFKPAFSFMPDRHTVLLLHFDTDTPQAFMDDSGRQHNGSPWGTPQLTAEKR